MKKILAFLFSVKRDARGGAPNKLTVVVNSTSQHYKLQRKMEQKNLTHAETVTCDINNIRLKVVEKELVLFFCSMKNVVIRRHMAKGDGRRIPTKVTLEGFQPLSGAKLGDAEGYYDLKRVLVTSNGTITISPTSKTVWKRRPALVE